MPNKMIVRSAKDQAKGLAKRGPHLAQPVEGKPENSYEERRRSQP